MPSPESQQSPQSGVFYGYFVVGAAFCIMLVMWGTYYAFGVFFKPLLADFGWTRAMTSGAFSLSMVIHGLLGVMMGALTDRFGPRMVMTFCGLFLGLGYMLMSLTSAIWQLYLFYGVIIGIAMSGSWVPLLSTVARWFVKRRSMMTGIMLASTGIGGLIAPPLASWLISTFDWRKSYIIIGSLALAVIVSAAQLLRRDPTRMGQLPYGAKEEDAQGLPPALQGFSLREAVSTRQFWLFFAMLICFGFALFAVMVHIVPHATDLEISPVGAAGTLSAIGGLAIVGRVVLGGVGDRIGNRQVFIIGFILMSAALFWLVPARELWALYLFAVVFGFAHGGMGTSESPLLAQLFGLSSHGLIFGVVGLGFTIGGALGPYMLGYIFDLTGSYKMAFLGCGAIGVVGLILTALLTPTKKP